MRRKSRATEHTELKATEGMKGILMVTLPPRMCVSFAISFDWTDTTFTETRGEFHRPRKSERENVEEATYGRECGDAG